MTEFPVYLGLSDMVLSEHHGLELDEVLEPYGDTR